MNARICTVSALAPGTSLLKSKSGLGIMPAAYVLGEVDDDSNLQQTSLGVALSLRADRFVKAGGLPRRVQCLRSDELVAGSGTGRSRR